MGVLEYAELDSESARTLEHRKAIRKQNTAKDDPQNDNFNPKESKSRHGTCTVNHVAANQGLEVYGARLNDHALWWTLTNLGTPHLTSNPNPIATSFNPNPRICSYPLLIPVLVPPVLLYGSSPFRSPLCDFDVHIPCSALLNATPVN